MRYAILGDIHANLTALEAVLVDAKSQGADNLVSVGDVVGYGAAPTEVIQILREHQTAVVKGNHDAACTGELDTTYFNPYAKAAVEWTQQNLGSGDLEWLQSLPLTAALDDLAVAHGTWAEPERFSYVQCAEDATESLDQQPRQVCVVGHTHVPVTVMRYEESPNELAYTQDSVIDLGGTRSALVNVGSVGQPRDEDCRAAWGLFDSETCTIEIRRVEYSIDTEAARIRAAGLPGILADRLHLGI